MRSLLLALVPILALAPAAHGRTKLAALPARESTVIRLDNPASTLVEEERILALQEGENWVDFSWRGVEIDPDSIRLTPLSHPAGVTLLSVSYPPGEAALTWRLHSDGAREERVRISYLLSGIDRLVAYKAVADREETALDLEGFLVLRNFSGEDFGSARLNLGPGETLTRPIAHEETRRARLFEASGVPVEKTFTWDAARMPWEPERAGGDVGIPVHYVIRNAPSGGLGAGSLAGGKIRVFQDDGAGGTLFLGEDRVTETPVGGEMRVYVGDARDVVVTQRKVRDERIDPRPSRRQVRLYDTDEVVVARVENFKDRPVSVDLVEHIPGEWEMAETSTAYEKRDAHTLVFRVPVEAEGAEEIRFRYHRRNVRP